MSHHVTELDTSSAPRDDSGLSRCCFLKIGALTGGGAVLGGASVAGMASSGTGTEQQGDALDITISGYPLDHIKPLAEGRLSFSYHQRLNWAPLGL